jgi:hypothetical protein
MVVMVSRQTRAKVLPARGNEIPSKVSPPDTNCRYPVDAL